MFCYQCGAPLPEDARFCPVCGTQCIVKSVSEFLPVEEIPVPVAEEAAVPSLPVNEEVPQDNPVVQDSEPVISQPAPRKSRPLLVPGLILAGMFLVGLICFWTIPRDQQELPQASNPTAQSPTKPPLPERNPQKDSSGHDFTATDDDCFRMENGLVSFLPEKYDGGKILVIPDEIDGVAVTGIADFGFAGCGDISTIVLPNGLETIGQDAFRGCEDLRGIYLPESVRTVGTGAFAQCISMEAVAISGGVESIGKDAFLGCASLVYIYYDGTFEAWTALYNEYITPHTYVICQDGDYYHGVETP